jgi:hypothetical protein
VVIENITMCKKFLILFVLIIPLAASAQFQQRASLNLSAGFFKTLGEKTYMPDWGTSDSDREKFQMPNYRPGFSSALSFQYNINRRFSLLAEMGYIRPPGNTSSMRMLITWTGNSMTPLPMNCWQREVMNLP